MAAEGLQIMRRDNRSSSELHGCLPKVIRITRSELSSSLELCAVEPEGSAELRAAAERLQELRGATPECLQN